MPQRDEQRYREIFERTPVALLEEDVTEAAAILASLRATGVTDFDEYFRAHPELMDELAAKVVITDVNPAAVALFDVVTKEQLLLPLGANLGAEAREVFHKQMVSLARGESRFESETTTQTSTGKRLQVLLTVAMLGEPDDQVRGLVSIVDISARKRIEDDLRRANLELERSNRELEQFAYVASHDMQEPLRMVSSYTQLLARNYGGQLDDRARKYIDYAVDGARRMQALVNDLLELSRVGTTGRPLRPVDCGEVLQNVLADMRMTLDESGAQITCEPLPTIMADPRQLAQLFQNLVSNGVKFRGAAPPHVRISAARSGPEWILSVTDNGIGIPEKHIEEVFVIFRRLNARSEYPGTGIGLAIAKKIVERHGGRIWVESAVGVGTTFHVAFPALDT